ncbi:MAG: wax ester/triacylglycerol synthase family O-acyltransferase, partial [Burkholderiales bacterium]|nr:wax ester/triacylglycerol synthase family O-acyltransferase [Burkholderiales bacterium]
MKHLSGLDASFLHMETPEMPMHVGGLNLFDLPKNYKGDFYEDVKAHVVKRMHLASVFTKKLALMPLEVANPVWVDDDAVDLDYHIRKISLPKPGSMEQLEAYVGRLHSSLLDRSRPLWEFYVFDGLASGQAAFYSKIHHAALDGQGAAVMAQALLDISPIPREVPPAKLRRKSPYQPKVGELINAALRDTVSQCWRMVKGIPNGVKAAGGLVKNAFEGERSSVSDGGWGLAPKTPLNVSITNQRVFATAKIDLDEAKLIGKVFEASLNDVVLAICSGALRHWLASKGALPSKSL